MQIYRENQQHRPTTNSRIHFFYLKKEHYFPFIKFKWLVIKTAWNNLLTIDETFFAMKNDDKTLKYSKLLLFAFLGTVHSSRIFQYPKIIVQNYTNITVSQNLSETKVQRLQGGL